MRTTGKYFILHGGDDLQVFLENGLMKLQSNKYFGSQNQVTLGISQRVITSGSL